MAQVYVSEEPDVGRTSRGRISLEAAMLRVLVANGLISALTLPDMTVSGTFQAGVLASGEIGNTTPGSIVTSNIPGIVVDNSVSGVARPYRGTPTASGTVANGFSQSLTGYTTRNTSITIT